MIRMSSMPARTASSTTYWIAGLSTTGSISLGIAFVAGRNRVPSPAAGITAFVMRNAMRTGYLCGRRRISPMADEVAHEKRALRAELRERRRITTSREREIADEAITQNLIDLTSGLGSRSLAAYLSLPEEPGTREFVAWA